MKKKKKKIDIVVPSYNEAGNVEVLFNRLKNVIPNVYDYRVIFVDDGSTDGTLEAVEALTRKHSQVKYISFSKNFGHQIALKAGLDHSNGDCVVSLDADLQHPPELIPELIRRWEEGDDIVYTKRIDNDNVGLFKKLTAKWFYNLLNGLSGLEIDQGAADFRLLDKKVVDVFKKFEERNLFIRGMVTGIGFRKSFIEYEPEKRIWGKSKYSLKRMFLFALDGITSFSVKPLHLATIAGVTFSFFSGLYALYAIIIYFTSEKTVSGWTSVLVSVLFMGGVQLIVLGILGEYLGKMFLQTKNRPNYIVKDSNL
ncbi:glycosyltransferase family 2 protein [Leptospira kmetyi]|uniref:glycosyltransferase family 2 protein n=1 Tax=Leptospira kmetyi TaxID=408139 RepID=UPI0010842C9A|nr:glycosyltransferase family 2 protein [Leptospira kmetyi]TGK21398.1 glycosyltransferase [Leptospira kmetyi]TGK28325.1 glycosyltransferase [Leptospira kmetyi]TGL68308.1 glycosyltransferase [Leptospira kmetyi]